MGVREEVRAKRAALEVEPVRRVPEPHEDLSDDFFRSRPITKKLARQTEHDTRVAPVCLGERVVTEARKREIGVARILQIRSHVIRTTEPTGHRMTRRHRAQS